MNELAVTITDGPNGASKVVHLEGEMDEVSIENVKAKVDPFLNDPNIKAIVMDLGKLTFINSKGIGLLVAFHTHLSKDQRALVLAEGSEAVMDVVSLVGLTSIIKYFDTLEEALQNL